MVKIKEEERYALYDGERQITDYIYKYRHDGEYYVVLGNEKETSIYDKVNKKFIFNVAGELYQWYDDRYFVIEKDNKFGVFFIDGREIVPLNFDKIVFQKQYITVIKDGKRGAYEYSGKQLCPTVFDSIINCAVDEREKGLFARGVIDEEQYCYICEISKLVKGKNINITKTGIIEVLNDDKWEVLSKENS